MQGATFSISKLHGFLLIVCCNGFFMASSTQRQTDSCSTPDLVLLGSKFHTIMEGEEITLSCRTNEPASQNNVEKLWYLQFQNISDPIDQFHLQHYYVGVNYSESVNVSVNQTIFNITVAGLTASMQYVLVQCTIRVGSSLESFSKGTFLIHILPGNNANTAESTLASDHDQTSTKSIPSATPGAVNENIANCTSVKESLMEVTFLTTAMCACLIVNTVTLLMVVIILCRIRKKEPLKHDVVINNNGE